MSDLREIYRASESKMGTTQPFRVSLLETLVHIYTSHQSESGRTRRVFCDLKQRFPDFEDVAEGDEERLEEVLRPGGMSERRSWTIIQMVRAFEDSRDLYPADLRRMDPTDAVERLQTLPGIGPKTARCAALYALGLPVQPIDSNIYRVLARAWRPSMTGSPDEAYHQAVEAETRGLDQLSAHVNLIAIGRAWCRPSDPDCANCPIAGCCDWAKRGGMEDALDLSAGANPQTGAPGVLGAIR